MTPHRFLLLAIAFVASAVANADTAEPGGRLQTQDAGRLYYLPTVRSDYSVKITGDLATVTLKQVFRNNLDRAVNARYLFPLNKDAAVYAMTMEVGDEIIRAKIDRKKAAKQTFEKAKAQGKSAVLLEQHRPNMFTQNVANLAPDAPITVTLQYVQTVERVDGEYELVLPLVVGPRYQGKSGGSSGLKFDTHATGQPGNGWAIDKLPEPKVVMGSGAPNDLRERVSIDIQLDGALPIAQVSSETHAIDNTWVAESVRSIALTEERVVDNRDFVLRYSLAGQQTAAGVIAHQDTRGGFFSLLVEPPASVQPEQIAPREMVFVLDCSGSMSGQPLDASKLFMEKALRALRPNDSFRIIRFSESATEFSTVPLPATPANIEAGLRYTRRLSGSGGTEMSTGVLQALQVAAPEGSIRLVTFLTDGYIGSEGHVLALINQHIGSARLFALGVGSAPNRYLLSEMGLRGRGFVKYLDPTGDPDAVTSDLASRLQSPVLTDIAIDWGALGVSDVYPKRIPDLFAGQSVRVQGRFSGSGKHTFTVNGLVSGKPASLPVQMNLDESQHGEAIALVWARSAIADQMRDYTVAKSTGMDTGPIEEQVTSLGLLYNLVTRWTSFVAVSERRYNNDPNRTADLDVAQNKVAGTNTSAYPAQTQFVGHGAPEPGTWMVLFVLLGMLIWAFGPDKGNWASGFARRWRFDVRLAGDANLTRKDSSSDDLSSKSLVR